MMYVPMCKNCGIDFQNFDFKTFWQLFLNVTVELSRLTGRTSSHW